MNKNQNFESNSERPSKPSSKEPGHLTPNEEVVPYRLTEWLGAVYFYLIKSKNKPFSHFYQRKFEKRNSVAGYIIYLFLFIVTILVLLSFLYLKERKNL